MMVKMIVSVVAYLILAPFAGGFLVGLERKFTARIQGRKGPSVRQPFYDVKKLFNKETADVKYIHDFYVKVFLFFVAVSGVAFFAGGDMLFVMLAFLSADVFLIISAYTSNSDEARIGAEHELISIVALSPMIMFTAVGFYMYCGSLSIRDIVMSSFVPVLPLIGIFLGFTAMLALRGKRSPFDVNASGGFSGNGIKGISSEFTGKTLAYVEIAHWYETVIVFGFIFLFFSNGTFAGYVIGVIAAFVVYFAAVLINGSLAGMKWKHGLKAAWTAAAVLGAVNVFMLYVTN